MRKMHFIINPQARNGYCSKVWEKVEEELRTLNISYTPHFTKYRGNGKEIASTIAKESNGQQVVIAVVGGDGTLNEVINGVVDSPNVLIGFIPGGSGNDFSRGYGIPKKPLDALRVLLQRVGEEPILVDIGKLKNGVQQEYFFINNMGAGLDALISKEANHSRFKGVLNRFSLGSLVYAYILIKKLFTYKCTNLRITIDGEEHFFEKAWFVTVSNQPFYGGGMKIAPEASSTDGFFNVTVVRNISKLKLLLVFVTVFWGGHTSFKAVNGFKGQHISIHSSQPIFTHVDGEHIGETPVDIQVCQGALPVLIKGK